MTYNETLERFQRELLTLNAKRNLGMLSETEYAEMRKDVLARISVTVKAKTGMTVAEINERYFS